MATSRNHKSVRNDLIDLAGHGDDIREASDALKAMAHPLPALRTGAEGSGEAQSARPKSTTFT